MRLCNCGTIFEKVYKQLFIIRWESRQCALLYSYVRETQGTADLIKQ